MSTCQGFLLRKFITCSAVQQVLEWTAHTHQRFAGLVCWSHSATLLFKFQSRSQSACRQLPQKISVDVQKDCVSSNFSFTDLETHWCCVERIVKLCVFLILFEFLCDKFTVHRIQYPTVPHLLQLYHTMQDLRGRMQRSVMQDVGWEGHEGHVSWALVCRSSVALCAVDFCHCSTVGARDCFSAVEFIGNCSFRTSIFVGTSFVCEDHSMLETLGWRKRAVAGAPNWYSNVFEYIEWLSTIEFDHGCFTCFSYLDRFGHFFAATIVFWYFYTLSGSVHLWQSCTVASSLKKDRSWNWFALWGFETWSPRNVEYFMLCKQSKEERVQQMYQDNPRQTLQINRIK